VVHLLYLPNYKVDGLWHWLGYSARTSTPAPSLRADQETRDGGTNIFSRYRSNAAPVMYGHHSKSPKPRRSRFRQTLKNVRQDTTTAIPKQTLRTKSPRIKEERQSRARMTIYDTVFSHLFSQPRNPTMIVTTKNLHSNRRISTIKTPVTVGRGEMSVTNARTTEKPFPSRISTQGPVITPNSIENHNRLGDELVIKNPVRGRNREGTKSLSMTTPLRPVRSSLPHTSIKNTTKETNNRVPLPLRTDALTSKKPVSKRVTTKVPPILFNSKTSTTEGSVNGKESLKTSLKKELSEASMMSITRSSKDVMSTNQNSEVTGHNNQDIWEPTMPISIINQVDIDVFQIDDVTEQKFQGDKVGDSDVEPLNVVQTSYDKSRSQGSGKRPTDNEAISKNDDSRTKSEKGDLESTPLGLKDLTDYTGVGLDNAKRGFRILDVEPQSPYCHMEEKVSYKDKCESYTETTCHSVNRETCQNVAVKNCSSTELVSHMEEICFNTTDRVCTLVEVESVVQEEVITLEERCDAELELVCDHIYEVELIEVTEEQCVEVNDHVCASKNSNCTEMTHFQERNITSQKDTNSCDFKGDTGDGCGPLKLLCKNVTSQHAKPVMTEICRDEPIIDCRTEEVIKPVDRKKFIYTEYCTMVLNPRCKMVSRMKLEIKCSTQNRPVCEHRLSEEKCKEDEMEYCYQVEEIKKVEVCDELFQTIEI